MYRGTPETIARPEITGGQPDRELARPYVLQMAKWETLPVFKKVSELTLGRRPTMTWVFGVNITYGFIVGLDVL